MAAFATVDLGRAARELDLEWRLKNVPTHARTRGVFFNLIRDEIERRKIAGSRYAHPGLDIPRKSYGMYPTSEFLEMYAAAAALMSQVAPGEAARQIFTAGSSYYANNWFGRTMTRYLKPDPMAALRFVERSREYFASTGRWHLEVRGPTHAVLHMFDEYIWIEHAHRGGCEGLLVACGVTGEVTADLDTPFCGRLHVRWTPHS